MRISDWSSDVCSSDLVCDEGVMIDLSLMRGVTVDAKARVAVVEGGALWRDVDKASQAHGLATPGGLISETGVAGLTLSGGIGWLRARHGLSRSEEHTSELQPLMRISYAVFCLKKKK